MTMRDMMGIVEACKTEEEASALVQLWTEEARSEAGGTSIRPSPIEDIRAACLSNIGYITGYMDKESHDRVLQLFKTEHPVFGLKIPTAEEAFAAGLKFGKELLRKRTNSLI